MNKEECFGLYVIQEGDIRKRTDGLCGALTEMNCEGCNFFKPLGEVIENYIKTGYIEGEKNGKRK